MVHFVIIISISKVFQVQNKPMGFLPPIQMKGLITMKLIHTEYNPMHNSIDINHYNGYILRIDCNQAESGIRTTPNSQRCLNALAIDNPLEYARLALDGEMQAWVDAEDSLELFKFISLHIITTDGSCEPSATFSFITSFLLATFIIHISTIIFICMHVTYIIVFILII